MTPRKKTKTSQYTFANKFDPLSFRSTNKPEKQEEPGTSKEAKRTDRTAREAIAKGQKENTSMIEDKFNTLGNQITNAIKEELTEGLRGGLEGMTKEMNKLTMLLTKIVTNEPKKDEPKEDSKENEEIPPTSQLEETEVNNTQYNKKQLDYQTILQRFGSLPPGQKHIQDNIFQKEWRTNPRNERSHDRRNRENHNTTNQITRNTDKTGRYKNTVPSNDCKNRKTRKRQHEQTQRT